MPKHKFRVVKITNNVREYPECEEDTLEFPHIVDFVDDEMDNFIVAEDGEFYKADEFFDMIKISEFEAVVIEEAA